MTIGVTVSGDIGDLLVVSTVVFPITYVTESTTNEGHTIIIIKNTTTNCSDNTRSAINKDSTTNHFTVNTFKFFIPILSSNNNNTNNNSNT